MSPMMLLVFIAFATYLISHFGGKIAARTAGLWWIILFFLCLVVIQPEILHPFAKLLGVQLISNLVLAILVAFLFKESLENSTRNTSTERRIRALVSEIAAKEYLMGLKGMQCQAPTKKVLVFLPTYNEEQNLPSVIEKMDAMLQTAAPICIDICFVDDGSTDSSRAILAQKMANQHTCHSINIGVAGGLLTAAKIVRNGNYNFLAQCDADGQHPIALIPQMIAYSEKNGVDLLIGSRFTDNLDQGISINLSSNSIGSTTLARRLGGLSISWFLRALFGRNNTHITDPTSGFRIYSKRACCLLESSMPDDYPEPESIALLSLAQLNLQEVRVAMMPRLGGESSISGLKSIQFMLKVMTALLALRIRTIFTMIRIP